MGDEVRKNYQKNNIHFRIASAEAISRFKANQSNSFCQIARKDLNFTESCKETILLEYDKFFTFITYAEKVLLGCENEISEKVKTNMISNFKSTVTSIDNIMRDNTDIFLDILEFSSLVHKYSIKNIVKKLEVSLTFKPEIAFASICQNITDYLEHLLLSIHEYNNILSNTDNNFLCVSSFDNRCDEKSLLSRTNWYISHFGINNFILKNFSHSSIIDIDELTEKINENNNDKIHLIEEQVEGKSVYDVVV